MKKIKIIFAGGGTGGHIYPAIVVSQEIKKLEPDSEIIFVGTGREIEKKIINHYGFKLITLKIHGLKGKNLPQLIKSLSLLPKAMIDSIKIIKKERPNLVIGAGGYSSGPLVLLASVKGIPTAIMEQNLKPGLTNRILKYWVKKAFLSFDGSQKYFKKKGIYTGNPVRDDFLKLNKKERNEKISILIFGGSQGAHIINKVTTEALLQIKGKFKNMIIYHQTGEKDFEWVKDFYFQANIEANVSPFFFEIHKLFEKVDFLICRAGASTLAEIIASKKPAILIPYAKASNNHQEINALELKKKGFAEVLLEKDLTPENLAEKISKFIEKPQILNEIERNLERLKLNNPGRKVAKLILEMSRN
jgi:UDP-N-acetylglucosamine--N-acetylmuramyl-(pentapeptide) pyrophosphoryl-undecaprenol N-acetylglucosamine transferase